MLPLAQQMSVLTARRAANSYLSLDGGSGCYASTPDSVVLSITGDIDIGCKVSPNDWTPSGYMALVAKYNSTGNQRSYGLYLHSGSDGKLSFFFSSAGTSASAKEAISSIATGATDGAVKWVRVVLDVNNGSGGWTVRFYLSDDGITWTQLGADVVGAGTASIFDSTAPLEVGSNVLGTSSLMTGKVYSAEVRNGIDGALVSNPRFDQQPSGTTGFADAQGNVWTLNGSAAIVAP